MFGGPYRFQEPIKHKKTPDSTFRKIEIFNFYQNLLNKFLKSKNVNHY